ncbi:MAG: hypothetical protein MRY21_03470 [Simkaniaceae bacterium]|nr:hypothetical protein [Simkaniaceae bacterium]
MKYLAPMLLMLHLTAWQPYNFYTSGQHTFKVDPILEKRLEGRPEVVLKAFLAKGGTFHRMTETSLPFELCSGDDVYPICSGGWCRSQTLLMMLQKFKSELSLHPSHAARHGYDPYDGEIHRKHNITYETFIDEYEECFGRPKFIRAGFENSDEWEPMLTHPTQEGLAKIREYYTKNYYGQITEGRRVFLTFSANVHVVMYRLAESNESLDNVIVVGFDMEDLISHPPKEWNTYPRSQVAYRAFYDLLSQLIVLR